MQIFNQLIANLNCDARSNITAKVVFQTTVLTCNRALAAVLPKNTLRGSPPLVNNPGPLTGKTFRQLSDHAGSGRILNTAAAMAAIDSPLEVGASGIQRKNLQPGDIATHPIKNISPKIDILAITGTPYQPHPFGSAPAELSKRPCCHAWSHCTILSILFNFGVDSACCPLVMNRNWPYTIHSRVSV